MDREKYLEELKGKLDALLADALCELKDITKEEKDMLVGHLHSMALAFDAFVSSETYKKLRELFKDVEK